MSKKKRSVTIINEELEEIKTRWLRKEISINELTHLILQYKNRSMSDIGKAEELQIIKNKLLLDSNVEASTDKLCTISLAFIPIMISYIALFTSLIKQNNYEKYIWLVIVILLTIGLALIVFPVLKKHSGKYSREKTFYQIVIDIL